jgi:hypothetical protein
MWSNPSGVKLFYAAKLIRLQAGGISQYVFYSSVPPLAWSCKTRNESSKLPRPGAPAFCVGRKLQEERCEQWVSDARNVLSILLGDFASLIRLSIAIKVCRQASFTPTKTDRAIGTAAIRLLARRIIAQGNTPGSNARCRLSLAKWHERPACESRAGCAGHCPGR